LTGVVSFFRTNAVSISEDAVREQLRRLVTSPQLAHSGALAKLLRFVVEETLQGRGDQLKETRLGLEVFARPAASYDAAIDPIVRVQMGRLRARIHGYYAGAGRNDPVLIEIPKGSYAPSFGRPAPGADRPAGAAPERSDWSESRIAVLPFVDMSAEPRSDYFGDGLTEELIHLLARDRRLQVVARTSSFQFKGQSRDIREIGRLLGAGKIVEGSVRRAGTRVRVTVQLINAADGCHVWSERYEREITDLFAIHDEIAKSIHGALSAQLAGAGAPRARGSRPENLEAYQHYLQGRFFWNKRTEQGLRSALEHFGEAVRLNPAFARAHSGLADCHLMLGMSAAEDPARCMPEARAAAQRSLELDDGLAEAHTSLAAVENCHGWNRAAATAGYERAQALDPGYPTAHHWNGLFNLATAGRLAEAEDELDWAVELDPLSPPIIADVALVHCLRGDFDAAIAQCRRARELDPAFHRPDWFLGLTLAVRGDFAPAEEALQRALAHCRDHAYRSRILGALGFCYGRWGKKRRAEALLQELEALAATRHVPRFDVAQILAGMGAGESALASLRAAVEGRESFAIFIAVWPTFRSLAADPALRRLMAKAGTVPAMLP